MEPKLGGIPEAPIAEGPHGHAPEGPGWWVLNAAQLPWGAVAGGGTWCSFEGKGAAAAEQLGIGIHVLAPGESSGKYHAEADQEGFLVLSGECLAIVEGQERRMGPWDYFHCPAGTAHIIVGAGDGPCALVMVGGRTPGAPIRYLPDALAARHGVAVATDTSSPVEAYADRAPIDEVSSPWGAGPSELVHGVRTDAGALLTDTRAFVADVVLPGVARWDRDDELPAAAADALDALNLTGALVSPKYGGPGRTVVELVPVWRSLSQGWISLTGAVNPSGLAVTLLQRHGSPEQQERWLPALGSGAIHASFSITEPQAGSDLARLETTARRIPGYGLELTGTKRWVAGGVSSDVVFMLVLVDGAEKPSCVVLPTAGRGTQSWRVEEIDKMGYRGVESAAYRFDAHHEPGAEVLGGPAGVGRGARQMLDALDVGRVNVACRALGILDRCLAISVGECVGRKIGDGVLGDHTHAQLRVGELRARTLAAAALTEQAARAVDAGDPASRDLATAAKLIASDAAVWGVDRAARLAASRSYGADDELARLRRDAPQTQIGEGANDALLMALARGPLAAAGPGAPA